MKHATLEELAIYLPYALKVRFRERNDRYCRKYIVGTIGAIYSDSSIVCHDTVNSTPDNFKPILRPLSDLAKDNEFLQFCKEQITCADLKVYRDEPEDVPTCLTGIESLSGHPNILLAIDDEIASECPLLFYQWLAKHHYDLHGLIDRGAAIDINTLNQQHETDSNSNS
ncbi:hypothetical protein KDU71_07680 [Carboxylicivirga sediminis]|uniref:Uncharacterized protein n=1 Tax=Carboxylicivirga sediminis TaxID=2006564 RepID=A0A941IY48_9BACT|nr:hypothetical protein [Carboxylicivirga sediminis]MBR8535437.1 hypothetical protein [Carboxylicivirga sediminis]